MGIKASVIWQPKFSTKEVLVAKLAVKPGKNYLYFVADRNHPDLYSYDGDKVRELGKFVFNGKIVCYAFPLDWLVSEGDLPEELEAEREKEYKKFKKFNEKAKEADSLN